MALSPGRLRHRITIMREVLVDDGHGADTSTWEPRATVWAEVLGQIGREATIGQALQGIAAYKITIRYRDDILPSDQIVFGNVTMNIRSAADPFGDLEQLLIVADTSSVQRPS